MATVRPCCCESELARASAVALDLSHWVQESVSPAKESSLTSEVESGSDCQDAFLSQEDHPGKAGAAIVTIPKAEKDVDDFDVRSKDHIARMRPD